MKKRQKKWHRTLSGQTGPHKALSKMPQKAIVKVPHTEMPAAIKKAGQKPPAKAAQKTARRRASFYSISLCIFLSAFALISLLLLFFWFYLSDYQKSLPENQTDEIIADFENKDTAALLKLCTDLPASLSDPQNLSAYLSGIYTSGSVGCYENSTSQQAIRQYVLYAVKDTSGNDTSDTIQLATLVLSPAPAKTFFGHTSYSISSLTLAPLHTYTIYAPSNVTVMADGTALPASCLTDSQPLTSQFAEAGLSDVSMNTYTISGLTYIGNISADSCSVVSTSPDTFVVSHTVTDSENSALSSFAEDFAHAYSVFATKKNASSADTLSMVYSGSSLYHTLSAYDNDWGQTYTADRFDDLSITSLTKYEDHAYSLKISFSYVTTGSSASEKSYDFDFVLYLTDADGSWKVISMKAE